jgi:hypothetical protein
MACSRVLAGELQERQSRKELKPLVIVAATGEKKGAEKCDPSLNIILSASKLGRILGYEFVASSCCLSIL